MRTGRSSAKRHPNRRRTALIVLLILVFCASSMFFTAIAARGAETLFRKYSYTSLCIQCGEQKCAEFVYVLDNEVLESEHTLALSRQTKFPGRDPADCEHIYSLVGRTGFTIGLDGKIQRSRRGHPEGDLFFAESRVKQAVAEFHKSNPRLASSAIERLAKERYAGKTPDLTFSALNRWRNRFSLPLSAADYLMVRHSPPAPARAPTAAIAPAVPALSARAEPSAELP